MLWRYDPATDEATMVDDRDLTVRRAAPINQLLSSHLPALTFLKQDSNGIAFTAEHSEGESEHRGHRRSLTSTR